MCDSDPSGARCGSMVVAVLLIAVVPVAVSWDPDLAESDESGRDLRTPGSLGYWSQGRKMRVAEK